MANVTTTQAALPQNQQVTQSQPAATASTLIPGNYTAQLPAGTAQAGVMTPQNVNYQAGTVTQAMPANQSAEVTQGYLDNFLSQDNALMRNAAVTGNNAAAARGLRNSSMAAGNAQKASLDAIMPLMNQTMSLNSQREGQAFNAEQSQFDRDLTVAQQNATMAQQAGLQNAQFGFQGQQAGLDREQGVLNALLNGTLTQQNMGLQNQYDVSGREQQFGYNTSLAAQQAEINRLADLAKFGFSSQLQQQQGDIQSGQMAQQFGYDTQGRQQQFGYDTDARNQQGQINASAAEQMNNYEVALRNQQYQAAADAMAQQFGYDTSGRNQQASLESLAAQQAFQNQSALANQGFQNDFTMNNQQFLNQSSLNNQQFLNQTDMAKLTQQQDLEKQKLDNEFRSQMQSDATKQQDWLAQNSFNREFNANMSQAQIGNSMDMYNMILQNALQNPQVYTPEVTAGMQNFFQGNFTAMMSKYFPSTVG